MDFEADTFSRRVVPYFESLNKTMLGQRVYNIDAVTPGHFGRGGDLTILRETLG